MATATALARSRHPKVPALQTTAFFVWLRRRSTKPQAPATIDQVIDAVARKMNIDRNKLFSSSRERRLTLTRALIGWHVTKNQIGTLTEVSRRLGRDPSSVYTAYLRYQMARPQLFREPLSTILKYLEEGGVAEGGDGKSRKH